MARRLFDYQYTCTKIDKLKSEFIGELYNLDDPNYLIQKFEEIVESIRETNIDMRSEAESQFETKENEINFLTEKNNRLESLIAIRVNEIDELREEISQLENLLDGKG